MYIAPHFLSPALDGGERSAVYPDRLNRRETAPSTRWIRVRVVSRAHLKALE
jgi:hypothetical protein